MALVMLFDVAEGKATATTVSSHGALYACPSTPARVARSIFALGAYQCAFSQTEAAGDPVRVCRVLLAFGMLDGVERILSTVGLC